MSTAAKPKTLDEILVEFAQHRKLMQDELQKVIIGQNEVIEQLFAAIFTRGHCLLEGVPGLAKTLMVSTLAKILDVGFKRVQFTPDLMPSDITGTNVLEEDETGRRHFRFVEGPIFTNILLADEINRTPPKTQAALLQAMQEREVSVGQETYQLPDPFFTIATQNPIEQEGTYPLPEAQLDRFMFNITVGYPTASEEEQILMSTTRSEKPEVRKVLSGRAISNIQKLVAGVAVSEYVVKYAARLVRAIRLPNSGLPPPTLVVSAKPLEAKARTKAGRAPPTSAASPWAACNKAAPTKTGRWEISATARSWDLASQVSQWAPTASAKCRTSAKASGSVVAVGVATQGLPANKPSTPASTPASAVPAIGWLATKRGTRLCQRSSTGAFTEPTSVTTASGSRAATSS